MKAQENHTKPPKPITLFLMTEKGYEVLKESVRKYKSLIKLVVVGSDKTLQKDFEEEIINLCIEEKIDFVKRADFADIKSEYAMAISWRWLINHPPEKLIVLHDSLLPKYRGFAPLVNSLINGEKQIGVTAIFGAADFDTGDIIAQYKSQITYPMTIAEAIQINNGNYIKCADFVFRKLGDGEAITGKKQVEREATYSVWRDEEDYKINWRKSAGEIQRFVDALGFPYKGASTTLDGKLIRILKVEACADVIIENRDCGKVLFVQEGKPVVICGRGMLKIIEAQIEDNGKIVPFFPLSKFRIRFV